MSTFYFVALAVLAIANLAVVWIGVQCIVERLDKLAANGAQELGGPSYTAAEDIKAGEPVYIADDGKAYGLPF